MAFRFFNKKGEKKTVYNPSEKSRKYCKDLKSGVDSVSNEKLNKNQKAWRAGYMKAQQDNMNAFKAKKIMQDNPAYKRKAKHFKG